MASWPGSNAVPLFFSFIFIGCQEPPTDPDFRSHDYGMSTPRGTLNPGQRPQGGGVASSRDASLDSGPDVLDGPSDGGRADMWLPPRDPGAPPCPEGGGMPDLPDLCGWFSSCLASQECESASTSAGVAQVESFCAERMTRDEHLVLCGLATCGDLLAIRDYCLVLD